MCIFIEKSHTPLANSCCQNDVENIKKEAVQKYSYKFFILSVCVFHFKKMDLKNKYSNISTLSITLYNASL